MRVLLLAVAALAQCSLLAQAFAPGALRSAALLQPLPRTRTKAVLAQPLKLFPSAAAASKDKQRVDLSAVRVIPVSDSSPSLWQRLKNQFSSATGFFKEYQAFMRDGSRATTQQAGTATGLSAKIRAGIEKPAFQCGLEGVAGAFLADLMIGKEFWGRHSLRHAFRPVRLLGVMSHYMVGYETSLWLDSKFPERTPKNMMVKGILLSILLGPTDPVAVTKFPVYRGESELKLPGMKEFALAINPLLRILSFALPLRLRSKVTSTFWAAISFLWTRLWIKGRPGYEGDSFNWGAPMSEPF